MKSRSPHSNSKALVNLIAQCATEPVEFDHLIEEWNALFETQSGRVERSFKDVEAAAFSTIGTMPQEAGHSSVGRKVAEMLETFESPAYLVRENGKILTQNKAAFQTFELGDEATLDDLPLDLEGGGPIGDAIRACLVPGRNSAEAVLKRAFSSLDESPLTLSITPSKQLANGRGEALVFVVDARWKTAAAGLIKREFDLTDSERQLLEAFLDGQTTQDMAANRGRSHATVRTQFHSLMSKMGARSQTELFRNALSVSQFVDKVEEIAEVLRHPYRKRVDIMRPGGRSVELTLSGDFTGRPFVFIHSAANYTFVRIIEQAFYDAGICMLSLCRPGTGDTDPCVDGTSLAETTAQDIEAVLDQLGHSKCILMTSNMASAFLYRVGRFMPDRLMGLVQIAGPVPIRYQHPNDQTGAWTQGTTRAVKSHPRLANFLFRSGVSAWVKMGHKAFMKVQFRKHKDLLDRVFEAENLTENLHAFNRITAQDNAVLTYDVKSSFDDFNDDIQATVCPILVIHGANEETFPIASVRRFAAAFEKRVSFIEIPDAGFGPLDTHTKQIIAAMNEFEKRCQD